MSELPSNGSHALHTLLTGPFGRLPGLVDELLVAVLGLFQLFGVALPKLRGTFLDGFRASRFRLFQLEGVARAGLPQFLFVLGDFV
jgi:hypothetical protein